MNKAEKPESWDPKKIEAKWSEIWSREGIYEPDLNSAKKPYYNLMMFPYPSAEGLHVGNMYAFCGSDIYGRHQRMRGNDVFEPIGLDGFGIHSENFALKIGQHPMELSKKTEANFYRQLHMIGNSFAWDEKLETYDPSYYRFTQLIFVQLFKSGLAYRGKATVNWCPHCLTVLADEQVLKKSKIKMQKSKIDEEVEVCERCGTEVERRDLSQWFFRITNYAGRLLKNLDSIDWSEKVKVAQRNWIGKSEGAKLMFASDIESDALIEVFTTRPDTIFGVTFLVLAPEHPLVTTIINKAKGLLQQQIRNFVDYSLKKTESERIGAKFEAKKSVKKQEKEGIFTGFYATNPLNGEEVPIYIADYVLMSYGTGAVMGVPAHDERDFEFAKKYKLEIKPAIVPKEGEWDFSQNAFTEEGVLANSGQFDGLTTEDGIQSVINYINENHLGSSFATWHLRDWIISRQRYWGPPIPMIFCEKCAADGKSWFTENKTQISKVKNQNLDWGHAGWYPVPEEDLPVELPYVKNFKPTGSGVSPLAADSNFVNVKCPGCGSQAKRETDVSDTFLDSAWYFLRYPSQIQNPKVKSQKLPWDAEITKKWLPVDMYIGGAEHAVLHLLYSRFLTMALYDMGLVNFEEPFTKFRVNGLLIKDGAKMSKSKGNVVNPDDYIQKFGADTLRCYLMFCGRFSQGGDFRDTGIEGMQRFLRRVWKLATGPVSGNIEALGHSLGRDQRPVGNLHEAHRSQNSESTPSRAPSLKADDERMMHKTIKKVTQDIESLDYNTALAALMEWMNFLEAKVSKVSQISSEETRTLLLLLAPFAPFMTEELWQTVSRGQVPETRDEKSFRSIHQEKWPEFDEDKIKSGKTMLIVQVDGKMREKVEVDVGISKDEAEDVASKLEKVSKYLESGKYSAIYVPNKIINFVTEK